MASKGKGKDKKGSKKEKAVEEPPPPTEEKKEDEAEENPEEKQAEETPAEEQETPKEPTPEPEYDEPTLAELIVEEYEGDKVRGLYDGDGEACFTGNHKYKGQFSQGLMHGKGKYTWSDGLTYEGEFTMNEITGKGLYTWPDRSTYEGEVFKGKRNGHGTFRCPSCPASYTGQWYQGKRHGTGRIQYDTDGHSFYEGDWVNNKRHGYGVRRYKSGNVYEGDWANNNRHGQGIMRWVDIDQSYSGQWDNGIQHGHGEHTWYLRRLLNSQYPLRNQYIGDFVYGRRHGFGVFLYANGSKYEGEWVDNKKHGRGVFTFKNGRMFEGVFVDDRMAEFPAFAIDGENTPDISEIRTRTPDPAGPAPIGTARSDDSRNTLGPSMTLDLDHLLNEFNENDKEEEMKQVLFVTLRHMTTFKKVYNFYSSLGHDASPDNTFIMTRLQFWRFLKDCQFHYRNITLMEIDRILAADKEATDIHSPLDKLLVREFLNNIITLSYHCFKDEVPDNCRSILAWCLDKAIKDHVVPDSCDVQGHFLHDPRRAVNALGYMDRCWEVYRAVCNRNKYRPYEPTLKMREFLFMLKDYRLINERLTPKRIMEVLSADDPMAYDHKDCNLELEMTFLEFFEALIGCAKIYVTEEIVKDPNTPRPSTVISQAQTSYSGTTPGTQSRTSQREEDSEDHTTGQASPNQTGPSETASPGPRVVSSSEITAKTSGEMSTTKLEASDSQIDIGQEVSNTMLDDKTVKPDDIKMPGGDDSQPTLLQSMLSMGAEPEEPVEEEIEEEMDDQTREFNFWTHQIHIFFLRKLFPAYGHMLEVEAGKERLRMDKVAAAIEAERQREERKRAAEAARLAEQQAEDTRAKEAAEKAASGESVGDQEPKDEPQSSPSRSPSKGRWESLLKTEK